MKTSLQSSKYVHLRSPKRSAGDSINKWQSAEPIAKALREAGDLKQAALYQGIPTAAPAIQRQAELGLLLDAELLYLRGRESSLFKEEYQEEAAFVVEDLWIRKADSESGIDRKSVVAVSELLQLQAVHQLLYLEPVHH